MATITLTPTGGSALELKPYAGGKGVWLPRENNASFFPVPQYDEEYAESTDTEGGLLVRSRLQNAVGNGQVILSGTTEAEFAQWKTIWDQTVQQIRRTAIIKGGVGGTLAYTPDGDVTRTYDILSIRLVGEPYDGVVARGYVQYSDFEFTCKPLARLTPVALVVNSTSTLPVQEVQLPGIGGAADALVSATFTDTAGQARDHFEGGVDFDWDGLSTALIDSSSMSIGGFASALNTRTGAYNGATNNVIRVTLGSSAAAVCEAAGLTHRGRQRIKIRAYAQGAGPQGVGPDYVRAAWRVGAGPWNRTNSYAKLLPNAFSEIDLGIVRCSTTGTLTVRLEAYGLAGDVLDVDYMILIPMSRYFKARAPVSAVTAPATYIANDSFNQAAGVLTGKTIPVSTPAAGVWAGAGNVNDFSVDATSHYAQRTAVADAGGTQSGRFAIAGTGSAADVNVRARALQISGSNYGVFLRYQNVSNFLLAYVQAQTGFYSYYTVVERIGGVDNVLYSDRDASGTGGSWHAIGINAAGSGWSATLDDGVIATGATSLLAAGTTGFWEQYQSTSAAATRAFDDFTSYSPEVQHVANASGAITVDDSSIQRSDGARPPSFEGRYLQCPPAGREGRIPKLVGKLRRADISTYADSNIADGQRVDVIVTPRVVVA